MDAWSDVEGAIQAAIKQRNARLERLVAVSSMLMLLGAIWLVWPILSAAAKGEGGLLNGLGMPILVLIWGLLVQDIGLTEPSSRTRVGASATIAWPVLLMISSKEITSFSEIEIIGPMLVAIAAGACFTYSKTVLTGGLDVQRFRSLMTGVGFVAAFSIFVGDIPEPSSITWLANIAVLAITASMTVYIWVSGDEQKELRREFRKRLDKLETRILVLKTENAAVDQASSLVMTAREEGHVDPELGMKLLDDAEEDINRSLSLAGDVQIVKEDARKSVEQAEEIAPTTKKARKSFDMGLREIELGSLREGEMLFRQAKKRSMEIIEWWQKAEQAITEASRLLDGKSGENINHLQEMLADAKKKLSSESPKKAFEYAFTIPDQLSAGDDALTRAAEAIKEAERQLGQSDGLETSELTARLDNASAALDAGNASQAIGLADGIVRSIKAEREAMDDTRRALRQKKKLVKQFENRQDSDEWQAKLDEIVKAADDKQWTHAATLLDRMTAELDKSGKETEEAKELLDFVSDEWKILRNQLEAAMIKPDDKERLECEACVAKASEALGLSNVEECLENLSKADDLMEKLRRRI
ncbi:MAG TPA: hypothetical protein HA359_03565 [Candidatus Poseidoniaceae archaeon]|nr:MAG TPA: hypothetical protein D7H84_03570 [Candidatus Poseidoniales archaeon]DAC57823.1 MAG TPA: hypothetical protein D7I03_06700 [Candidatus Poseidoniales archaeon]HII23315.1 hypothetical protein [Candidatus Poseidoniaceae archaeon]HII51015.1 hypothetical protein [Candidatus Poseidoniaceae archaeon]